MSVLCVVFLCDCVSLCLSHTLRLLSHTLLSQTVLQISASGSVATWHYVALFVISNDGLNISD
ncbi:hypothetical protein FKM82_018735 [Ascaphus truei]